LERSPDLLVVDDASLDEAASLCTLLEECFERFRAWLRPKSNEFDRK
jgi:hypothetical protein